MAKVDVNDIAGAIRFDKLIEAHHAAAPVLIPANKVRIFRPSRLSSLCPVEAVFAMNLLRKGTPKSVCEFVQTMQLPAHLTQVVDTGTVIHTQLQYYAGLMGFCKRGKWRCPNCGAETTGAVPMPVHQRKDPRHKGISNTYARPCVWCKGKNLKFFPPWRYVEIELQEQALDVPVHLRTTGHVDQLWDIYVKKFMLTAFVDYKTINEQGFNEQYGHLPKDDHVEQLQYYLGLAKQDPNFIATYGDVNYGIILYYNKNKSQHKLFVFKYDPQIWLKKQKEIQWARKGNLKEIAKWRVCPNVRHKRARECYFVKACWGKVPPANLFA